MGGAVLLLWASLAAGQTVSDVVGQISQTRYRAYLGYPGDLTDANNPLSVDRRNPLSTHSGDQRNNGQADWTTARSNMVYFQSSFGLTATVENTPSYYNVVSRLTGTTRPQDIYIVGSHYDSVGNPGADDNASGTAALLEAARVLSQFQFEATILFIAFDMEEDGLLGSNAYATAAHARGDNILGMVEADMIAFNAPGNPNRGLMYGRTDPIKSALGAALQTYGGLSFTKNGALDASDHAPFEWNGYPACVLIESYTSNPNYHQLADNVDTAGYLDYNFATNMTRGIVGWLAGSAGLLSSPAWATRWNSGAGLWSDANCWGAGLPDGNTNANVTNGGTVALTSAGGACYRLYLGAASTQAGTLIVDQGSLACASASAKVYPAGVLRLGGGALTASDAGVRVNVDNDGLLTAFSGTHVLGQIVSLDPNLRRGAVQVDAGASLNVTRLKQDSVTVAGKLIIRGASRSTTDLNTLSIAGSTDHWTGTLDLKQNYLVIRSGSLETVTNQIKNGFNGAQGGHWDGNGITSSTAGTHAVTAVGVATAGQLGVTTFGDANGLSWSTVLARYTWWGDCNLDGVVDIDNDFTLWQTGYQLGLTGWFWGDFNYDGVVDIDNDFTMWQTGFQLQGTLPSLSESAFGAAPDAIPEPGTLSLLALGLAGLVRRRRK